MELLAKTNVGRDINRHYYTKDEIDSHLERPVIKELNKLMRFRNSHPAFNGAFNLLDTATNVLHIQWTNEDEKAELILDLAKMKMDIRFSEGGEMKNL